MQVGSHQVTQEEEGKSQPSLQKDWPDKARLQRSARNSRPFMTPGVGVVRKGVWEAALDGC